MSDERKGISKSEYLMAFAIAFCILLAPLVLMVIQSRARSKVVDDITVRLQGYSDDDWAALYSEAEEYFSTVRQGNDKIMAESMPPHMNALGFKYGHASERGFTFRTGQSVTNNVILVYIMFQASEVKYSEDSEIGIHVYTMPKNKPRGLVFSPLNKQTH